MPIKRDMFLRKSKSRTELFVLLPNKPKDIMSPTNGRSSKTIDNSMGEAIEKSGGNEQSGRGDNGERSDGFKTDLSDLILVKSNGNCLRDFDNSKQYDIMDLHRKYEKLREYKLGTKICDAEFRSDGSEQSWTSSENCQRSPRRSPSAERKSVRFEDDLTYSQSFNGKTRNDLVLSSPREDLNHNTVESKASRIPVLQRREPRAVAQKPVLRRDRTVSQGDESVFSGEISQPRGILCKTLSENPFNIKRSGIYVADTNFMCHECGKMFKYQSNLKTHVMTVHGGALNRSGGQKSLHSLEDLLICDVCSLVFKYSVNLRAHKAGHSRNKMNATI